MKGNMQGPIKEQWYLCVYLILFRDICSITCYFCESVTFKIKVMISNESACLRKKNSNFYVFIMHNFDISHLPYLKTSQRYYLNIILLKVALPFML